MAITLDQATVFFGNDGGVGDNPAVFTTTGTVASGAYVFVAICSNLLPSAVTVGGTSATKARDQQQTDFASLWYVLKSSGMSSGASISVSFAAVPNFCEAAAFSFTGLATSSVLDQVNSQGATASGTAWSTSSITPTASPSLVVGYANFFSSDIRSTPDTGWTELFDGFQFNLFQIVYQVVSDTAARNPSGVLASNPGVVDRRAVTANFLDAAAGGSSSSRAVERLTLQAVMRAATF